MPGPPDGAGPHYNVTPYDSVKKILELVSDKTEVWLDLDVNSDGDARSTATVSFIPEGERSIVLHAADRPQTNGIGRSLAWPACRSRLMSYGN